MIYKFSFNTWNIKIFDFVALNILAPIVFVCLHPFFGFQVTSLLRRVLPEVSPPTLASILNVQSLPPSDFSIISESNKDNKLEENSFDIHNTGILDVFLACIGKALTVQTKVKGSSSSNSKGVNTVTLATSIHPRYSILNILNSSFTIFLSCFSVKIYRPLFIAIISYYCYKYMIIFLH